jgi:hypothetical protein
MKGEFIMKERPIIMGAESVQAILDGRKTQTRRVVGKKALERFEFAPSGELIGSFNELHPEWEIYPTIDDAPYKVGYRLWVRETWAEAHYWTNDVDAETPIYRASDYKTPIKPVVWKSPMYMPRWASRITLEITDIRVERLQDITAQEAIAEGMPIPYVARDEYEPISMYRELWEKLNSKRGYPWESNPWVWVIEFKVV